jgi:steroid 5-alpha reductase family enzyme
MFDWSLAANALTLLVAMATVTWATSLVKRDASIADSLWPLLFLAATLGFAALGEENGPRWIPALILIGAWALRLCAYITWRNWGQPEDRRYRAIRERNQPHYELKSLIVVFWLQAALAWIIAWPVLPVVKSAAPLIWLDILGIVLFNVGLVFQAIADFQLTRFKADPTQHGRVMDRGLWRYSRHPNFFAEFVVWWSLYLLAISAHAPIWTILSPLLISFLLIKVSGIPLLEADIAERRPGYREYIERTSAFLPWPPKPKREDAP